jgi:hypothetical protein
MIDLLKKLLEKYSILEVSEKLNLTVNTIQRWLQNEKVPDSYLFELFELDNAEIDYSQFSSKQKDQFFTPLETVRYCFEVFTHVFNEYEKTNKIPDFVFIEPSAGDGSFLNVLPKNTISMDIEPRHPAILKTNFLKWNPNMDGKRFIVFGNPPFGLRGHLALKFINHSYSFADYVCFILPQLFESDGKGVPRKRVQGFNLIHSQTLDTDFYEPDGEKMCKINTIFQIWSKHYTNPKYDLITTHQTGLKVYSISDGGSSSSTRNKKMIGHCDVYLPSTCFGKENMKCYSEFEQLPNRRGYGIVFEGTKTLKRKMIKKAFSLDWNNIAFLSTNSAINLRSSQIYANLT